MVKEAYCSYEVSKLLKKKGFNIHCDKGWDTSVYDIKQSRNFSLHFDNKEKWISCPTHQLAMAWLRSKGYSIEVYSTAIGWHWQICKLNGTSIAFADILPANGKNEGGAWDDYDECTEAALKYCLENLI